MKDANDKELDLIFQALSDTNRRNMLLELTKGEKSVGELGQPTGLSKQLVSKHLKVLERAHLIIKQKDGRIQRCQFNPETLEKVHALMDEYRAYWNDRFDALENYVETLKEK